MKFALQPSRVMIQQAGFFLGMIVIVWQWSLLPVLPNFSYLNLSHSRSIPGIANKKRKYKHSKNKEPLANVVVAFSFTPQEISEQLEHGVPSIESRLKAIHELSKLGWQVGVRIDPVIDCEEFEKRYRRLFKDIFEQIRPDNLHSVSLGAFRMPIAFFKKMEKLYPKNLSLQEI